MSPILPAGQPISRAALCRLAVDARWFEDYGPMLGMDGGPQWIQKMIDEFARRDLIREQDRLLISQT